MAPCVSSFRPEGHPYTCIAHLLADEVVPMLGVPKALLSDRGTNLSSHLVQDVKQLLGIIKLNTMAYHPQCDVMAEQLNQTLKAMLRKSCAKFGRQWDRFLPGVLWANRNMPHESTKEKPPCCYLVSIYDHPLKLHFFHKSLSSHRGH